MSVPSDLDAYSYAKFLVDIFPEDAIEILCRRGSSNIIEVVAQQVDRNCLKLGASRTKIKGMVEERRWDELKLLRGSPTQSATTTPRHQRRTGEGPPTPSSTASASPQSQRNPGYDWIIVYGTEEPVWFTASPSGSEEYLIGEDKLERLQGVMVKWTQPPKRIALGGKLIDVSQSVHFTWNQPGDKGTHYKQFWVVRSELIRHTDVLLGYGRHPSREGQGKAPMSSPLALGHLDVPPAVPTPPQMGVYQGASSTTSIHSIHDSPTRNLSRLPLRTTGRTATMNSGPPPPPPSQPAASIMERELSRPGSASSTRTTKSSRLDTVLVHLSFERTGNRLVALDLTMNGDEIIPFLEPHIFKVSRGKQLDRSIHEITITSLKESESEAPSSSLDEAVFEYIWDGMVDFMRRNRSNLKPEFRVDIG